MKTTKPLRGMVDVFPTFLAYFMLQIAEGQVDWPGFGYLSSEICKPHSGIKKTGQKAIFSATFASLR